MLDISTDLAARTVEFEPSLRGLLALGAGILIFVMPRLLSYIVAAYLVITGLIIVFNI